MNTYLVQHYLDNSANIFGNKVAVFSQNESITFKELYLSANKLANCLRKNGVQRGDRVLLVLPKSVNFIKAMAGIVKADACYVPIDTKGPLERAIEILKDCRPSAIICDASTLETGRSLMEAAKWRPKVYIMCPRVVNAGMKDEFIWQEIIDEEAGEKPAYSNIDSDLAYILYTSGSTGRPKGVMISHLNIKNYIDWAAVYFGISPTDNILNTSPLHFDMSVFDIYCCLKTGASLTLTPKSVQIFPVKLVEIMEKNKITIWKAVSSLLSYFVKAHALRFEKLKDLRKVIFSGEPLPTKYLIEWMRTYPEKDFYNAYGPTEATGISTCYRVENIPSSPHEHIPIGMPCSNTDAFAVKHDGKIAGAGEIGELYIRGYCLSHGYWNDLCKTEIAFKKNPFNNNYNERVYCTGDLVKLSTDRNFVFVGRKDEQVKYMGYRIELGEIETPLGALDCVNDAAVLAMSVEGQEIPQLIAFVELNSPVDSGELCKMLRIRLPAYMIPRKIQVMKKIPRTENGKVDRQYLKKLFESESFAGDKIVKAQKVLSFG